jgi:hypothetical protein
MSSARFHRLNVNDDLHDVYREPRDPAVRRVMVRYKVRPESADNNVRLVRAVYDELAVTRPPGFRYATFRLDDEVSFVHIAFEAGPGPGPLPGLAAFQEFQRGIRERCEEPPVVTELQEVGSFGFEEAEPV